MPFLRFGHRDRRADSRRGRALVETLEGRALCSGVTGTVQNVYPDAGGNAVTTPLALWRVYDDSNNNGTPDGSEAATTTDLSGFYSLQLTPGRHTIRLQQKSGWATPGGYGSSAVVTVPSGGNTAVPTFSTSMVAPTVVDVAAFYADSNLSWGSMIPEMFRKANQVFANSDTNVRLNLVAVRPANYAAAGNLSTDLSRLQTRGDGYMDQVPGTLDQLGADIGVLFDPTYTDSATGLAYLPTPRPNVGYGYAVCCYTGNGGYDDYIVAHEVGHTLGADHDAGNRPGPTPSYARGFRFTGNDGVSYHDVMAYPPGTTLPFFSSPGLSYAGRSLGDANADNVRAIRQTAPLVAQYRASKSPSPVMVGTAPAPTGAKPQAASRVATVSARLTGKRVLAGSRVSATAVVRNTSSKRLTGKVMVAYYLSTDRTIDAGDRLLYRRAVPTKRLKPNSTLRTSATLKLDRGEAAGRYYVLAVATMTGKKSDEIPARAAAAPLNVGAFQTARTIRHK